MYGVIQKALEAHGTYYVILRHTGTVWSMRHGGSKWVIIERSGGFWVMIQRKEKRKKRNEVRHLLERGHDITPLLD